MFSINQYVQYWSVDSVDSVLISMFGACPVRRDAVVIGRIRIIRLESLPRARRGGPFHHSKKQHGSLRQAPATPGITDHRSLIIDIAVFLASFTAEATGVAKT